MDSVEYIQSSKMEYLGCFHANLKCDLPSLISLANQFSSSNLTSPIYLNMSVEGLPGLKEIYLGNSRIDRLEIGDSLILRYVDNHPWSPVNLPNSAVDTVVISEGNHDFYLKDSLLYMRAPEVGADGLLGVSRGWFESIRGEKVTGYPITSTPWNYTQFGDAVVATVGFPRGEWFLPKNLNKNVSYMFGRFVPVPTYCCDFVDKIMLTDDSDLASFRLNTFAREGDRPIEVYLNVNPSKTKLVLECCLSPLMHFIVPKGKLGRFIAAGFPVERLTESTEETLAVDAVTADPESGGPRGTYDISGRRIPDGATLSPGIYIIDGRKTIVR